MLSMNGKQYRVNVTKMERRKLKPNTAERMMKGSICMGRKNYLFCGSGTRAKNASMLYSIIETCKMNGLRPVKYIAKF